MRTFMHILVGGAVCLTGFVIYTVIFPERDSEQARRSLNAEHSQFACKRAVEARLTAPSTAVFQSGWWRVRHDDHGSFLVNAYVDSQNAFGAQIRTSFTCIVDNPNTPQEEVSVGLDQ